jgi:GxxExxY protein
MEVHNQLGHGFSEIVYKDALMHEFGEKGIDFEREKKYLVYYKDILLPHYFYADFIVFGKIILEVKCVSDIVDEHMAQTINYLKVSGNKLGLIVNFARGKLEYKRKIY